MIPVQVGQVWGDRDKRRAGRTIEVTNVSNTHANCELVTNGKRVRTKIRLDRFRPKYYTMKGHLPKSVDLSATNIAATMPPVKLPVIPVTKLAQDCAQVLRGTWGSFGNYAFFDNDKVHIIVREIVKDRFDVKVRINGLLISSEIFSADLNTTLGQIRSRLKSLGDNISNVVN